MNSEEVSTVKAGTDFSLGEKIALTLLAAEILYLFIVR